MEHAESFFRQRAGACFHRRRKHPVLSGEWKHEVDDARKFISYYRRLVPKERPRPGQGPTP